MFGYKWNYLKIVEFEKINFYDPLQICKTQQQVQLSHHFYDFYMIF